MTNLKLRKLADRTPVKLSISIMPDLQQRLRQYADLYADAYGQTESVNELIPAIVAAFLDEDRALSKARRRDDTSI